MQYSLIPSICTGDFAHERWLELTQPLRQHANALVELAAARGLVIRASSRWPEIGLRRSSLLSVHEARVSLKREAIKEAAPMLARRSEVVTDIALLTQDELGNGQRLLVELSKAIAVM